MGSGQGHPRGTNVTAQWRCSGMTDAAGSPWKMRCREGMTPPRRLPRCPSGGLRGCHRVLPQKPPLPVSHQAIGGVSFSVTHNVTPEKHSGNGRMQNTAHIDNAPRRLHQHPVPLGSLSSQDHLHLTVAATSSPLGAQTASGAVQAGPTCSLVRGSRQTPAHRLFPSCLPPLGSQPAWSVGLGETWAHVAI